MRFWLSLLVLALPAQASVLSCTYPPELAQRNGYTFHLACETPCLVETQPIAFRSDPLLCPAVPVGQDWCVSQWKNDIDPANWYTFAYSRYCLLDGQPVQP